MGYVLLLVLLLIPAVAFFFVRHHFFAWLLACMVGVPILWARLLQLEVNAVDSDIDIVFHLATLRWTAVLAMVYAVECPMILLAYNTMTRVRQRSDGPPANTPKR